MQTLSDFTAELRQKQQLELTSRILDTNFDRAKPFRLIAGICCSSSARNAHGDGYLAMGARLALPIPLLLNHDWLQPIGLVTALERRGDAVHFKAELATSGRLAWAEQAWQPLIARQVDRISMQAVAFGSSSSRYGLIHDWTPREISLVETGADRGARVTRVWEKPAALLLNGPNERLYWSAP